MVKLRFNKTIEKQLSKYAEQKGFKTASEFLEDKIINMLINELLKEDTKKLELKRQQIIDELFERIK